MKKIIIIIIIILLIAPVYILIFSDGKLSYITEVEINSNIDHVIELFDDADNLKEYFPEMKERELISGIDKEVGATYKIVATTTEGSDKRMEMMETIIKRDLPNELSSLYTANGVENIVRNKFISISDDKTKVVNESEFLFNGYMKIFSKFFPSIFKNQTSLYMNNFKDFAEKDYSSSKE